MNEEQLQEVIEERMAASSRTSRWPSCWMGTLTRLEAIPTWTSRTTNRKKTNQLRTRMDQRASSEPEAEDEETAAGSEEGDEEDEPVIVAKDGKHEIPYQKLVEARDSEKDAKAQAKQWQEIAEQKEKLIEAMKAEGDSPDEGKADSFVREHAGPAR